MCIRKYNLRWNWLFLQAWHTNNKTRTMYQTRNPITQQPKFQPPNIAPAIRIILILTKQFLNQKWFANGPTNPVWSRKIGFVHIQAQKVCMHMTEWIYFNLGQSDRVVPFAKKCCFKREIPKELSLKNNFSRMAMAIKLLSFVHRPYLSEENSIVVDKFLSNRKDFFFAAFGQME